MATLLTSIAGLLGASGTGAAAATAATATTATAAASTGISLSTILQGTASVLGILTGIGAANAEGDALDMQAKDAEAQKPLETLQGIERRASIKQAMSDALGAQDVAYAASGVDLSFGTASRARKDAFREADLALTTDVGTEQTRVARLDERAASYRAAAKRTRRMGVLKGISGGVDFLMSAADRG